jgi:DNA repair exonuclease SbcCD ATPase subunit
MPHAITANLARQASENGHKVYCPLGHVWVVTETVQQKLDRERERREAAERRAQASRDLLAAEERSHSATRGHLTRVKKRTAHGVCPCCNRTFQNVARHMESKHPEFVQGVA